MRHLLKITTSRGEPEARVFLVRESDREVETAAPLNDEAALTRLLAKAGGEEVLCDPALAELAKRLSLHTAPLSPWAVTMKGALTVRSEWGTSVDVHISSKLVGDFLDAAGEFLEAAPWKRTTESKAMQLEVSGADVTSKGEAQLRRSASLDVRTLEIRWSPTSSLEVHFQPVAANAAEAVQTLTGFPWLACVAKKSSGEAVTASDVDVRVATAALRAVTAFGEDGAKGSGESRRGDHPITVLATAI